MDPAAVQTIDTLRTKLIQAHLITPVLDMKLADLIKAEPEEYKERLDELEHLIEIHHLRGGSDG